MDGEFEKIRDILPTVECNTTAAKEHVSEAEITIRTVKERTRGLMCMLPFTHIPRRMKIEFVYFMVFWPNAFPVRMGCWGLYCADGTIPWTDCILKYLLGKIQGVDVSPPIEFPRSFHTIVSRMTNR
jgi:hypothetical protein